MGSVSQPDCLYTESELEETSWVISFHSLSLSHCGWQPLPSATSLFKVPCKFPAFSLSIPQMLRRSPDLNPALKHISFLVPDSILCLCANADHWPVCVLLGLYCKLSWVPLTGRRLSSVIHFKINIFRFTIDSLSDPGQVQTKCTWGSMCYWPWYTSIFFGKQQPG